MNTNRIVYLPLPSPPRRTAQHDETRLAVHKKVRDAIRLIAKKHNKKISEVIWNAVVDHWLLRMPNLKDLHVVLSPDEDLNGDISNYVGRGIADALQWDSKSLDEKGMLILADTGYNDEFHDRVMRAAADHNLRVHQLMRMPTKELRVEKRKVEKEQRKHGLSKDDFDILPTINAIIKDREVNV